MSTTDVTDGGLNDDIWLMIIDKYVDLKTQIRMSQVCKRFRGLVVHNMSAKRALLLTDDSPLLVGASDEDLKPYHVLSVKELCEQRDGLWLRGERGLRLLSPIEIQELSLKYFPNATSLCLVITRKFNTDHSPIDVVLRCCPSQLTKLVIVNTSIAQFVISMSQMQSICDRFPQLSHFELFSPYLYTSEECFEHLLSHTPNLSTLKLKAKQIFGYSVANGANGSQFVHYDSYVFTGMAFSSLSSLPSRISTIDCSHSVLTNTTVQSFLSMPSLATNITQLGINF